MSATKVENTLSPYFESTAAKSDYAYNANSLMKSTHKTHEARDLAVEGTFAVDPIQSSSSTSIRKPLPTLSQSDHLRYLLDSFHQFAGDNPELSPAGTRHFQTSTHSIASNFHLKRYPRGPGSHSLHRKTRSSTRVRGKPPSSNQWSIKGADYIVICRSFLGFGERNLIP
jgi:hypothetical protein